MRSKKSLFSYLLYLFVCLTVFSGCGESEEEFLLTEENVAAESEQEEAEEESESKSQDESGIVQNIQICVDLCGAVANPGVYFLEEGSRLYEAVEMAGGYTPEAALGVLNQAQVLTDGQQIRVLTQEELQSQPELVGQTESAGSEQPGESDGKVNINTVDAQTLMTLNGIGESRAQAILTYREENGLFQSVEQIKEVSGIGDGIFSRIKDEIVIE